LRINTPQKCLIQRSSSVSRPQRVAFLLFFAKKEKDLKIMITITKGVKTFDGKIPVTLLVDDVETANELIKLAKAANVPVVEQEDLFKSKNKTTQDKIKQIVKNKGAANGTN
jgi:hypothetical protein